MTRKTSSEIVIFDTTNGSETVILTVDQHIEAPNWTPDGQALIINGGGLLYRLALDAPELMPIDTGFATQCNNDHGISPDGKTLAISDSTEDGASTIYTLPITGGAPVRVTEKSPSYWHGWSPDGATLAYVANRGAGYEVYTIPVTGGDETQISFDFDHCDGPDYTPDGKWIWFNGERDGQVALWRISAAGGNAQKMTDDNRVNWFPHPSPDGTRILYLSYENGTKGHPANKQVELRMMPVDGGDSETLTSLLGGQGTINVPCWAPDSRKFAFVRYIPT